MIQNMRFFLGDNCIFRHQTNDCSQILDRFACLTSFELRNEEDAHPGSECVWCRNGVCPNKNESQCDSKTMIRIFAPTTTFTEFGFEDCLKIPSMFVRYIQTTTYKLYYMSGNMNTEI